MGTATTARQRLFAAALGLRVSSTLSRRDLSIAITHLLDGQDLPALGAQRALAQRWHLGLHPQASRGEAKQLLWSFLQALAFAYSVCRHALGASWQTWAESGLPEEQVHTLARTLMASPEARREIEVHAVLEAEAGDMWYELDQDAAVGAASRTILAFVTERMPDAWWRAADAVRRGGAEEEDATRRGLQGGDH